MQICNIFHLFFFKQKEWANKASSIILQNQKQKLLSIEKQLQVYIKKKRLERQCDISTRTDFSKLIIDLLVLSRIARLHVLLLDQLLCGMCQTVNSIAQNSIAAMWLLKYRSSQEEPEEMGIFAIFQSLYWNGLTISVCGDKI